MVPIIGSQNKKRPTMRQESLDYFRAIVWERCPGSATIQGGL